MAPFIGNNKVNLLIAFAFSIVFFIFNFNLLSKGHFHEDAYILFVYVENFINGHGIAFYPGGEPAEGATDFLWLLLLIGLGKLGLDTGTSVIALNSLGVFIITLVLTSEILKSKIQSSYLHIALLLLAFLWIFCRPLSAAVGGFSVFLYMALVLLALVTVSNKRYLLYTPYVSIVIALFRPDGVIIGCVFTLIGLLYAHREQLTRKYIWGMVFSFIVGLIYFIWRYNYFQSLLPLPLYVKSHGSLLSGLDKNIKWLEESLYIVGPAVLLAVLRKRSKHYLMLSLPVIFLFVALLSATQSQNVGYRFQAPIFIVAYFILIQQIVDYFRDNKATVVTACMLVFFLGWMVDSSSSHLKRAKKISRFNYINTAPLAINRVLPEKSTIAITEAGRMAYWNQLGGHEIIDLVGLNTKYPAKNTINTEYLRSLDPDVIMYHHAGLINVDLIVHNEQSSEVVVLNGYGKFPLPSVKRENALLDDKLSKVHLASTVATDFLREEYLSYDIFAVDYTQNDTYSHIYAVKKDLGLKEVLGEVLIHSFNPDKTLSYYEMIHNGPKLLRDGNR